MNPLGRIAALTLLAPTALLAKGIGGALAETFAADNAVAPEQALRVFWGVDIGPTNPDHPHPDPHSAELLAAVYDQLRAIAQERMSAENPGHTLQATALVHEAFLRIGHGRRVAFRDRAHFFATAAEAMRRILIDHARAKGAVKRRAPRPDPLSVADLAEHPDPDRILALDGALERLQKAEPEVAAVVRLRFFAGLSGDEAAEALGISPRQVDRHWAYARAWLAREIGSAE